jgi:hypothetical protein
MAGYSAESETENVNSGIYTSVPKHHIVQGIYYRGKEVQLHSF